MTLKRQDLSGTLVLGRYRVVKPLARGGMGIVYLARTEGAAGFARPVVIKRVVPDLAADDAATQAFVREARILSNLQHPDIVNVIDFDEEDGAYVMVLEYVHGYNVGQWHRYVVESRGKLPVDYAIYIMVRVLDALHYAHSLIRADGQPMQIVHRDVSPGNILIDTQGHVKLLDFGIARANEGGEYRTRDGLFKGKLTYAAPEVYEGIVASPRSDVYSAGVVLYQLLAGENPFRGKDMPEIIRRVLTQMPPSLTVARPEVSPALDAAVHRAIAKDPAARFPTAAAFADALRNARTRPEDDLITDLVDDVWNDFNGDMPAKLKLEPLQDRDAAWRASQDAPPGRTPTLSSTPPTRQEAENPTTIAPLGTLGQGRSSAAAPSARARLRAAVWIAAAGLLVLAGVGGAFVFSRREPPAPGADHFVVVERQAAEVPVTDPSGSASQNAASGIPPGTASAAVAEPAASAPSEVAASAAPIAPAKAPIDGTLGHAVAAGGAPDPQALSRTFQQRRGAIEGCFRSHATDVDGRPEISVRFHLAPSGLVESADLSPAALSATPLGQCLLGVARGTSFGAQSGPVSFNIPITARRVK